MDRDPIMSPSESWRAFFDRTSDALYSTTSLPDSLATSVAVVVSVQERKTAKEVRRCQPQRREIRHFIPSQVQTSTNQIKRTCKTTHVLPIPGGPDNKAAFHGPCGFEKDLPTRASLLNKSSHLANQALSFRTES